MKSPGRKLSGSAIRRIEQILRGGWPKRRTVRAAQIADGSVVDVLQIVMGGAVDQCVH